MTTITAREFNHDVSAAKRAAGLEPVITDRGAPAYVLLTIAEFRRMSGGSGESSNGCPPTTSSISTLSRPSGSCRSLTFTFLLDTNVTSELRKPAARADGAVPRLAEVQPPGALFLSVISRMELQIDIGRVARRDPARAHS